MYYVIAWTKQSGDRESTTRQSLNDVATLIGSLLSLGATDVTINLGDHSS